MSIELLARPEIRRLQPYQTASQVPGTVRLNANESPWPAGSEAGDGLNRYPAIRPLDLHTKLAACYAVSPGMLLATRGSSEAIDLLLRTFCRAGEDDIVVSPPTFAMYRVYADIQGAQTRKAPLVATKDFALDVAAVLETCTPCTKLVFVCSPNNPTGGLVPLRDIRELAEARTDKSLIVVDEAYAEFSDAPSATSLFGACSNIVVLRTLSKGLSLAGARCGAVLGAEPLIRLLNRVLPPYALATPVIDCALASLEPDSLARQRAAVQLVLQERARVSRALAESPRVLKVWPSHSNFLLVRFRSLAAVTARLRADGILIREFAADPALDNCARITIGKPRENDLMLAALDVPEAGA